MRRVLIAAALLSFGGALAAGCMALEAYYAPKFEGTGSHAGAELMSESECFSCHLTGKDGAPVAPSSMYGRRECWRCHLD